MLRLPEEIERIICLELNILNKEPLIYEKRIDDVRRQMVTLSDDFARSLASESRYADAYFALNFPINFMKAYLLGNRLTNLFKGLTSEDKIRILDLGCAEGAGMFGLFYALNQVKPDSHFNLTGIDVSNAFNKRCRKIYDYLDNKYHNIDMQLINRSVASFIEQTSARYDLIIISNALIEIFQSDAIPVDAFMNILSLTSNSGVLVIIEPALKNATRRLMSLHDKIISNNYKILLPCLDNYPCPLLRRKNEWCHQSIKWIPPAYLQEINARLYRKIEYLKFSHLVVCKQDCVPKSVPCYCVVSRLHKEKGRKRCLVCTNAGIVELMRLNRNESMPNKDFEFINPGDIICIENPVRVRPHFWKITENTGIKSLDF